jgi:hypothetical protein
MKNIIFTCLFLLTTAVVYGQTGSGQNYYHYTFNVGGITNLAEAKEITADLSTLFNIFPNFTDSTDTFDFISTENVTQGALDNIIVTKFGYATSLLNVAPSSFVEMKNYLDKLDAE